MECTCSDTDCMMQWRDSLGGVLGGLADVLAKRSAEKERETLRACQVWQQAAASLALALMSGAGISACRCPLHMSTCNCRLPVNLTWGEDGYLHRSLQYSIWCKMLCIPTTYLHLSAFEHA